MDHITQSSSVETEKDSQGQININTPQPQFRLSTTPDQEPVEINSVQGLDPRWLAILDGQVRESIVNAVWNQLLREVFQYPGFALAPEFYTDNGRKVDLVALGLTNTPGQLASAFAYEGKKGTVTENEFIQAVKQATQYLPYMYRMKNGRYYGMVAAGRKVAIIDWMDHAAQPMQVTGPNLHLDESFDIKSWDIQERAAKLDQILAAILQEAYRS